MSNGQGSGRVERDDNRITLADPIFTKQVGEFVRKEIESAERVTVLSSRFYLQQSDARYGV
jgi:hypothetical protein